MKKIIRLTERDLTRIVKRTIREMKNNDAVKAMSDWMEKYTFFAKSHYGTETPTRGQIRHLSTDDYFKMMDYFEKEFGLGYEEVVDLYSDYLETFPRDDEY